MVLPKIDFGIKFDICSYWYSRDIEEFLQNLKVAQIIYVTRPMT